MKVAIVGLGFVGSAQHKLFPKTRLYDPGLGIGSKEEVNGADVAFICVPTPCRDEGSLDTSIVEEVVEWCECPLIVIRSTLNPGTCDYLERRYAKQICHQPEYLGESVQHPFIDMKARPFLILGGDPCDRHKLIELYQTVYCANVTIRQMSNHFAEVVKLSENLAISHKLALAQELYDACEAAQIDYYVIREAVFGDDPRFNLWHTFVYPDKRGMSSSCLPKDVYAWAAWAESVGASASITRAILERNKEWLALNERQPARAEA